VPEAGVLVIQLSDSFAELWDHLGEDLAVPVRQAAAGDVTGVGPEVAVVVLAAGGAEREALEWLDGHEPPAAVPVLAVGADPGRRIAAMLVAHGASDYFALPEDVEILRNAVAAAAQRHQDALRRAATGVEDALVGAFSDIVGESPAIKTVLARAARVLPHPDATAIVVGETGTGKEVLARGIHKGGPRRGAPFVAVNCSALPENLIESELFGHERGAFTDAHAAKPGLFEVAEGGTLFLDEIGTLAVDLQAKLLRVLEDRQVRRVGGTKWRPVNVRIIAATNDDLEGAVKNGSFRAAAAHGAPAWAPSAAAVTGITQGDWVAPLAGQRARAEECRGACPAAVRAGRAGHGRVGPAPGGRAGERWPTAVSCQTRRHHRGGRPGHARRMRRQSQRSRPAPGDLAAPATPPARSQQRRRGLIGWNASPRPGSNRPTRHPTHLARNRLSQLLLHRM
jgi:hypothetical protein